MSGKKPSWVRVLERQTEALEEKLDSLVTKHNKLTRRLFDFQYFVLYYFAAESLTPQETKTFVIELEKIERMAAREDLSVAEMMQKLEDEGTLPGNVRKFLKSMALLNKKMKEVGISRKGWEHLLSD